LSFLIAFVGNPITKILSKNKVLLNGFPPGVRDCLKTKNLTAEIHALGLDDIRRGNKYFISYYY